MTNHPEQLRQVTERLAASEADAARYRALVETVNAWVWEVDATGVYTYASPRCRDLLGYTPEEMVGRRPFDFMPPEEATRMEGILTAVASRHAPFTQIEIMICHKDGHRVVVEKSGTPIVDAAGVFAGFRGVDRDVTEQKAAYAALQASEERLTLAQRAGHIGVFDWDLVTNEAMWTPELEELFGLPHGSFEKNYQGWAKRVNPDDLPRIEHFFTEWMGSTRLEGTWEYRFARDGIERWMTAHGTIIRDAAGRPLRMIGTNQDITERKHAETALAESRTMLQLVLDTIPVRVFWKDRALRYLGGNRPLLHDTGFAHVEELIGKTDYDTTARQQADRYRADDRAVIESGIARSNYEEPQARADGGIRWLRTSKIPLRNAEGTIIGVLGVYEDITERKQAEEALRRLSLIIERSADFIGLASLDQRAVYVNPAGLAMIGLSPDAISTTQITDYFLAEDLPFVQDTILPALIREGRWAGEFRFRNFETGEGIPVFYDLFRVDDPRTGEAIGYATISRDMRERKQAEMNLREMAERLRLANKATNDVIWDWDVIQNTQRWNEAGIAVFGWTEIVEHPVDAHWWVERVHPDDRNRVHDSFFAVVNNPELDVWHDEYRFRKADGTYADVLDRGYVLRNDRGEAMRMIGAMQDITERIRMEQALRQLNDTLEQRVHERTAQLEAANKELEAFTYSVSHDLRAPLRAIDGFSQAILEDYADRLDADGRENLAFIRHGAQQMGRLIDDLLRLSRVGRAEMRMDCVNMSALVQEIAGSLQHQEPDRHVDWAIAPALYTIGDQPLLRILLENLLGNAWKFTSKREWARIEFFATRQDDDMVYAIRDNGAGFDMAYVNKLFAPFQRLHSADEFPGTGIGLAIVQRIITRHGGRIWAEGHADQGATFYFTLPACKEA